MTGPEVISDHTLFSRQVQVGGSVGGQKSGVNWGRDQVQAPLGRRLSSRRSYVAGWITMCTALENGSNQYRAGCGHSCARGFAGRGRVVGVTGHRHAMVDQTWLIGACCFVCGNFEFQQHGAPPLAVNLSKCFVSWCQEHAVPPLFCEFSVLEPHRPRETGLAWDRAASTASWISCSARCRRR